VNVARDDGKRGVDADGARELCAAVLRLPGLALDGLMTIGALADDAEAARPGFRRVFGSFRASLPPWTI